MAGNGQEGLGDDFLEQILAVPSGYSTTQPTAEVGFTSTIPIFLQLGSTGVADMRGLGMGMGIGMNMNMMPLGLNLEHAFLRQDDNNNNNNTHNNASSSPNSSTTGINERDSVHMPSLFPAFGQLQAHSLRPWPSPPPPRPPPFHQSFPGQQTPGVPAALQPPAIRPRVRARRGQATDPHSIAERIRRERIAERIKALQELVPGCSKTDRAAMLDEIVDYVKFLSLQVKVLSMSRLGAAGAVAQLVADIPLSSVEGESIDCGTNQPAGEKWSSDGTEQEVAKLMEKDVGAAMQFLQSKALCIMPISLANAIFQSHQPDAQSYIKPESNTPS